MDRLIPWITSSRMETILKKRRNCARLTQRCDFTEHTTHWIYHRLPEFTFSKKPHATVPCTHELCEPISRWIGVRELLDNRTGCHSGRFQERIAFLGVDLRTPIIYATFVHLNSSNFVLTKKTMIFNFISVFRLDTGWCLIIQSYVWALNLPNLRGGKKVLHFSTHAM